MVIPSKLLFSNSSPTDECGNWCHQRLEGLPIENTRQSREISMASCKWPPASTITLKELQWSYLHIPITNVDLGWVGNKIEKQLETKEVIHKRSAEQATANLATSKTLSTQVIGKAKPCGHPAGYEHWSRRWVDTLT